MNYTYTITFSECVENHVNMQQIGRMASEGFSEKDIFRAKKKLEAKGVQCQMVDLGQLIDDYSHDAFVLVIRDGARDMLDIENAADMLLEEQQAIEYDTKYYDGRRKKVLNKLARHNVCFADEAQEANYEEGKGTVIAFSETPMLNKLREILPEYLGEKAENLKAEGNYYYDLRKCSIKNHGDAERRKVIALRLGGTLPLYYSWYQNSQVVGDLCEIELEHGDMYVMSEKAVGNDWRKRSILTLRHAAGTAKVLKLDV